MESTEPITIPIKLSKETKNTYRYDAVEEDAAVSNLYIQKKALPGGAPPELEINHQFPVRMQQQVGKLKKGGNSSDMLLKGERNVDDNILGGPQHSTPSSDAFSAQTFDFMLSNPPYGKSWSSDLDKMGGKKGLKDPRFLISHGGNSEYSLMTRTSDGQMLFLANMASKMKHDSPLGSKGKVQLIDATKWFTPLRKNLGQKNCELSPENVRQIIDAFMDFGDTEQSKIFPNDAFGYWKVRVERPLRLAKTDPERVYKPAEIKRLKAENKKDENAAPVIRKVLPASAEANPLEGRVAVTLKGKPAVVEYEPDTDLRDTEQVPLLHPGGIEAFLQKEVLPYAPDAWYNPEAVRVGYEVNFNRHFYKPQPMRSLEEIRADILALERETEGLLAEVIGGGPL